MLKKLCSYPGCHKVVEAGVKYCDKHKNTDREKYREYKRKRMENEEEARRQQFYNSKAWEGFRANQEAAQLGVDIFEYYTTGIVITAEQYHHIEEVADIIDTFGAIVEIIDISVNEKIRYLGTLLGGVPEEDQGSAFDEYDQENGYIEETTQEEIWRSYGDNLDAILQICIKSMRNSYKECLESDLSDLLDYVVFQVEYDREK